MAREPKVGQEYYTVTAGQDYDDDKRPSYATLNTWVVRTIRRPNFSGPGVSKYMTKDKRVYLVRRDKFTWKKSRKTGKFEWAKNIARIDRWDFILGHDPRGGLYGLHTTKLQAFRAALKRERRWLKQEQAELKADPLDVEIQESIAGIQKVIRLLKRRITKEQNARKKKAKP